MCHTPFDATDRGSNLLFGELFSPFSNFKSHQKSIYFNQKIKKVLGRVSVGVGRAFVPIRWHTFNNFNI